VAYKEWVETHAPEAIRIANNARLMLTRKYKKRSFQQIQDSRLPKRPILPRSIFLRDRYASGDLKGIPFADASKLIHREYDALSPSERKVGLLFSS
jgi:hypothetical protein